MPTLTARPDLERWKEQALEKRRANTAAGNTHILVSMGTCGIASGARDTLKAILDMIEKDNLTGIRVTQTGCIGLCEWEPIVQVSAGEQQVTYGHVSAERAGKIVQDHAVGGHIISEWVIQS